MSKSIYRVLEKLINTKVKGADIFKHNGSTWLIFEDDKRWVIELTKDGTLWYNFYFFQDIFELIGLDEMVNNQHHITKWVEDTIINGVKDTRLHPNLPTQMVEDTIQNGVKDTLSAELVSAYIVEDAIQNGVNYTGSNTRDESHQVEDTIQNGVKHTGLMIRQRCDSVENTIQNGVKETLHYDHHCLREVVGAIQNGVKETITSENRSRLTAENIIENGVKHTENVLCQRPQLVENTIQNGVKETDFYSGLNLYDVEDTIQNGIKLTNSSQQIDGSCVIEDTIENGVKYTGGIGNPNWMGNKVENAIENGVKEVTGGKTERLTMVNNTIQNGVKNTVHKIMGGTRPVETVIENGVKHTENVLCQRPQLVEDIVQNGVKHTEPGGYLGSIEMKGKIVHQLESPKQNEEVEDVIENGVKRISKYENRPQSHIDYVIQNSIKETKQEPSQRTWMSGVVVDSGIKETKHGIHFFEDTTENVIKHGEKIIKETYHDEYHHNARIGGVIKNGVKGTELHKGNRPSAVEDTIQNGIKETKSPGADGDLLSTIEWMESNNIKSVPEMIDDVITNGIKETKKIEHDRTTYHGYFSQERGTHTPLDTVQDVIKNGVKETQPHVLRIYNPMNFEPVFIEDKRMNEVDDVLGRGIKKTKAMDEWVNTENILDNVINNGVKELQPLPAQDGNRDWGLYYQRKGVPTKPHTKYVDEVITEGIKETWGYENQPQMRVNEVIKQGTKENPS